ncbi:MAG: hypothetical protein AMXMBFR64_63070 [Myxococcales bacterium]
MREHRSNWKSFAAAGLLLVLPACSGSKGGIPPGGGGGAGGPGGNASGAAESLANALAFQNEGAASIDGALPGASDGAPALEPGSDEGTIAPGGIGNVRIKVVDEDPNDPVVATLVWFEGASTFFSLPVAGSTKDDDGTISNAFTVSQDVCDDLCNIVHQVKCYEAAQTTSGLITKANLQTILLECTGSGDPANCAGGGGGGGGGADAGAGAVDTGTGGASLPATTISMAGKTDSPDVGYAKPITCADGKWYWVHTYLSDGYDPVQIYGPPEPGTSRAVGTDAEMDQAGDCHGKSHSMMRLSCDGPEGPLCDKGSWASVSGTVSAKIVEGSFSGSTGVVQGPFIEYTFDVTMAKGGETAQLTGSFRVRKADVDSQRPE